CTNKYLDLWLDYRKMTPWGSEKLDTVNNSFKMKKILDMYKKMPKMPLFLASIFQVYLRQIKNRLNKQLQLYKIMKKENILFMKNIEKKIVTDVFATNSKEFISIIEDKGYDVVSFDIFDTLIKRNVNKSSDVFGVLENEYRKYFKAEKPIADLRKQAESM